MRSTSSVTASLFLFALGSSVACAREANPEPAAAPAASTAAANVAAPAASPATSAVAAADAPAREPDPFFSGFEPEATWVVAIDGKVSEKGQIWTAQKAGNTLVLDLPELPELVVVQPRQQSVEAVGREAWLSQLDGTAALAADQAPRSVGALSVVGEKVSMSYDGRTLELREAPYQLGVKSIQELLASNAHYRFSSSRYRPSDPIVRNLRAISKPVEVKVFFGTWCPACSEVIPKVFAVAQALEGSNMKFSFYGLPKGEGFGTDPEAKKYSIRGVPTAVLLVDGKEVGRVDGGSWRIPELGIQNTLINVGIK